jgi:hypothetical protein
VDIGKPKRIHTVEPLEDPVPPVREPAPAPAPEPQPAAPERKPEKVGT